ncbi:uncharacterized protein LOC122953315 [Acropora millepora]|uniref:uncharacterized protein LOC122953315 n=1 Tax=Acropora millepora TaxID=45264 RepID=UPI001CF379DA|nr:uncharacterized protein LOC122953315 [Acropora millepora]
MFLILIASQSDFVSAKAVITEFEQTSPEVDKVLTKCLVEGDPSPDVTWYLGNTRLPDKRKYPDYDVTAAASLRVPTAAVVLHVFLCNCSNPPNSVAKLAKGQSFRIDNLPENPPNIDRTGGNSSSVSTSFESDGSFEGTYNFAAEDDEIDEQMFAGDRNSTPFGDSRHRYVDPTKLNVGQMTSTEFTEGGGIRLENYKPRVSPLLSPKDETTVYASVDFNQAQGPSFDFASTKFKGLAGMDIKGSFSENEEEPPDWVPPPPPIEKHEPQVQNDLKDQRASPDFNQAQGRSSDFASTKFKGLAGMDIKGSFSEQKEEPPDWVPPPPPIKKDEPQVQNDLEDQRTSHLMGRSQRKM